MPAPSLQQRLLDWYAAHGRRTLPWRTERSAYRTLVSEFMLQQTQVDRVVPKFEAFVERFPGVRALAAASIADVLRAWKGLGYNTRAVRLKQVAETVVRDWGGEIPSQTAELRSLPGIGSYTAAAIRAFAHDLDDVPLDTNVRRIVHRLAFGLEVPQRAPDAAIDARARELMPAGNAHDWNSALMDLGAAICSARAPRCLLCPLAAECAAAPVDAALLEGQRRSAVRRAASAALPFEKTARHARGRIVDVLRELPPGQRISLLDLHAALPASAAADRDVGEVAELVAALERDGLLERVGDSVALRQ